METDIHFMKTVALNGVKHKVLQLKNLSPAASLRYKRILKAKMLYTEDGRIIIRFKRKSKITYHLLPAIDNAIRQQKHIIDKHKKAKLPPRTSNSEHRLEVLLEEKNSMEYFIKTAVKIIKAVEKEVKNDSPDLKKIKNRLYFFDLAIAGLWVKPYFSLTKKLGHFISSVYLAAAKKQGINLSKNIKLIKARLDEFELVEFKNE